MYVGKLTFQMKMNLTGKGDFTHLDIYAQPQHVVW